MENNENEALKRARHLLNQQERQVQTKKPNRDTESLLQDSLETAKAFNENVSWLRQVSRKLKAFASKVARRWSLLWAYSGPVRFMLGPFFRFIGRNYARFFKWSVYKVDRGTGDLTFSKKRATVIVLFTASIPIILWYGTKPVLVTVHQGIMAITSEKVVYTYFHGAETIEEGRLYTIKTTSRVPATPDSTMHMHVQQDLIYWIWYPEDLANAVPNEVAWGRVKYTGWRWKPLHWFPQVKDVEAIPLSELPDSHPAKSGNYYLSNEDIQQAIKQGVQLAGTDLSAALN